MSERESVVGLVEIIESNDLTGAADGRQSAYAMPAMT
jgi:hypothetical protein